MTESGSEAGGAPKRRFRPTLWASVATLVALIILIGLGTWQLQRLAEKEILIAEQTARAEGPAAALPDSLADAEALRYLKVRVSGSFLHDREIYLSGRTFQQAVGFHVVTPLRLDDGRVLLVDRGWVPPERKDPATRPAGQVSGPVTLEGLLRPAGWHGMAAFRPENEPAQNLYFWIDAAAMAAQAGLADVVSGVYLEAGPAENPGGFPIGGQTRIELVNNHLQYALTWYALAVALATIYVLFHLRRS